MKMCTIRLLFFILSFMTLYACTQISVKPVDPTLKIAHVCIEENPKVKVDDFLYVIQEGFQRHGITTYVYMYNMNMNNEVVSSDCSYILKYTALRSWDLVPYLSHAELALWNNQGRRVAEAEYHLKGKGGFSLAKFQGTKTKMDPVIDQLLQGYR